MPARMGKDRRDVEPDICELRRKREGALVTCKSFLEAAQFLQRGTPIAKRLHGSGRKRERAVVAFDCLSGPAQRRQDIATSRMRADKLRLQQNGGVEARQGVRRPAK